METKLKQAESNCLKIVIFGPESTGKTTLSKQLATHYKTQEVPEYMRDYLQKKWNTYGITCEKVDLFPIAEGQMKLENEQARTVNPVLICDTNLLEIKVYSEAYYDGYCHPLIEEYALKNEYDLYLLTYIDTPWKEDDLRDKPNERTYMFKLFEDALIRYKKHFHVLKGNKENRFKEAINQIDRLLKEGV